MKIVDLNHLDNCLDANSAALTIGGAIAYASSTSMSGKGFSSSNFFAVASGDSGFVSSDVTLFAGSNHKSYYSFSSNYVAAYAWS